MFETIDEIAHTEFDDTGIYVNMGPVPKVTSRP